MTNFGKRSALVIFLIGLVPLSAQGASHGVPDDWCEPLLLGKWKNVRTNDPDLMAHFKHKAVIAESKTSDGYTVKFTDGKDTFEQQDDFTLSCEQSPLKASITGNMKIGACVHELTITVPNGTNFHEIELTVNTIHLREELSDDCKSHLQTEHVRSLTDLKILHLGTAHGEH